MSRIGRLNLEKKDTIFIGLTLAFTISPNPNTGNFNINASQPIKRITITDFAGKEILRIEPRTFDTEIDLSDKSPGLYFVKVFSESGSKCQKILKY